MAIATSTAAMISAAVAIAGAAAGTVSAVQQAEGRRQQTEYQSELAARNAQQAELSAQARTKPPDRNAALATKQHRPKGRRRPASSARNAHRPGHLGHRPMQAPRWIKIWIPPKKASWMPYPPCSKGKAGPTRKTCALGACATSRQRRPPAPTLQAHAPKRIIWA